MKSVAAVALSSLALLLAGCFQDTTVMKVNADGSGTITITTLMKTAAMERMKEMAKAFGGENAKEPEFFTEKQAKDKAAKMGDGVEFVSSEKVKAGDAEGIKATYSFKDITKLKISEMSDPPGGDSGGLRAQAKKGDPITFKFAKQANGNSLVTVVTKGDFKAPEKAPEAPAETPEIPEEQLAMMKEMMGGLKVSIQLEVDKLVKTNSPHVNGSTVTLMEIDFDKILSDMPKLKKLAGSQPKSLEEAKGLMKDFPGVKFNFEAETTIEFSGK